MKQPAPYLPTSLPPLGISRERAALFIGISPVTFDSMVKDGRMPKPKCIGTRRVWDRELVYRDFKALLDTDGNASPLAPGGNEWDG